MISAAVVSSLRASRIRPRGCAGVSPGSPRTCGITATPVSKPDSPSASFGKTSRATPTIASGLGSRSQQVAPVGDHLGVGRDVLQGDSDHHHIEDQVDGDQHDRDPDRLA